MIRFLFPTLATLSFIISAQVESPYESAEPHSRTGRIDSLVLADLNDRGIKPANPCSDDAFFRRVHLDLIGSLPSPKAQINFLNDQRPDKRAKIIDTLMQRQEFVDYWTLKWCDILRVKAEFPINLWPNGVQVYHRWLHDAVRTNMPYDTFSRHLLTSSGSNFRVAPVNFYRAIQGRKPTDIAGAVALTFMGTRLKSLSPKEQAAMGIFFSRLSYKRTSEWKEEIIYLNPESVKPIVAVLPDGTSVTLTTGDDPRKVFADWLVSKKNSAFTETIANRVWYWLMGRGIIHEPDDRHAENLASNPELLAALEDELVTSNFNLKHLFRLILNSQTYQQSSIPQSDSPEASAHFAHYTIRPMEAEVLADAITWICGRGERYASQIPEPFTFIPESQRAITLADGSITSQFLEMFGRPSRDTGLESERGREPSAAQRLFILNSNEIQHGLKRSWRLRALLKQARKRKLDPVTVIYRAILSRAPTQKEKEIVRAYAETSKQKPKDTALDLAWALINCKEFLYKH